MALSWPRWTASAASNTGWPFCDGLRALRTGAVDDDVARFPRTDERPPPEAPCRYRGPVTAPSLRPPPARAADASDTTAGPTRDERAVRNWLILVGRQGVISGVTIAGVFALAFLLQPADFAVYGYASSVMLIAAAIGDLGLGARLIKVGVTEERVRSSFGLQLVVWLSVCAALGGIATLFGAYGLSPLDIGLLVGSFFLLCLQTLPTAILEQRLDFAAVAKIEAGQRIVFVGVAVALAAATATSESITIATASASAVGLTASMLASRWRWRPRLGGVRAEFSGFASNWWQTRVASQMNYAVYPLLGGLLFAQERVALLIWALAVTSIPTLLSPLAGRAFFPTVTTADAARQVAVFRRVFRLLLLVSLPIVAATFACAEPLTLHLFGDEWRDGIVLLRLESVTTLIGVALTPSVALFFLVLEPRTVKRVVVGWTVALWALTPVVAVWASYLAPSIVQIGIGALALVAFDRMVAASTGWSLVGETAKGVIALVVAIAVGYALSDFADSAATTLALGGLVMCIQIAVTLALRGVDEIRAIVPTASRGAAGDDA
jgi:O-antigen/teichoic acid export membrane protein